MSSNPSFNAPVLNYVGSVDVASSTSGCILYNIFFDSSLCTTGNVLMFEYKIQPANIYVPDPQNITLGYINVENAVYSGIQNQWTINIPASDNEYNPQIEQEISVRVYSGLTGIPEIAVSPWSNPLAVHAPPQQPVIIAAVFSQNTLSFDNLWVFMEPTSNYDYLEVSFIVAYYFQDANGTKWGVSDPLSATLVNDGSTQLRQLEVPNIGNVDTYTNVVYTSVYAVYQFEHTYDNYYSVSEISSTFPAGPASNFTAPTITSVNYEVYDTAPVVPGNQTMVVNWQPSETSQIPFYTIANYVLQISLNGMTWSTFDQSIPPTTLSYGFSASSYDCGTSISFRVFAILQSGTETQYSNVESLNIFKYSLAPQNLNVTSATQNTSGSDITITFQNPTNIGCGSGYQYVINFINSSEVIQETRYVPYNSNTETYTLPYTGLIIDSYGTISVYLETQDTNPTYTYRAGQSVQTSYIVSELVLSPVSYLVYTDGTQNMDLTWFNPTSTNLGWSVDTYDIYLNGILLVNVEGNSNTYTYSAADKPCGTTLTFYIVANLVNSNTGTDFTLTSNSESINIFKYSMAPEHVIVNWASTNENQSTIVLAVSYTFPPSYNTGCGERINWVVNVTNSEGTEVLSTKNVSFNQDVPIYLIYINDVPYVANGKVVVFMQTRDTNNGGVTRDGASNKGSFIPSNLPIITDIRLGLPDRTRLQFKVLSQSVLSQVGRFVWSEISDSEIIRDQIQFITDNGPTFENGVFQYEFDFTSEFFGLSTIPNNLVIAVSNDVGIQVENVANS